MSKYAPLGDFLRAQTHAEVPMTFDQIERVIGAKLPNSHRYRAWWSNNAFNSVMTKVWLDAGFRTAQVDMDGRKLVFRRIEAMQNKGEVEQPSVKESGLHEPAAPFVTRHPLFGALKGLMRIVPGTDLTQPADPEWGSDA